MKTIKLAMVAVALLAAVSANALAQGGARGAGGGGGGAVGGGRGGCGGMGGHGSSYLGPEHDGVRLQVDPKAPLPFARPSRDVYREEQAEEFELIARLNRLAAIDYPDDAALRARIKSYELAARMQLAASNALDLSQESKATLKMYGVGQGPAIQGIQYRNPGPDNYARRCIMASCGSFCGGAIGGVSTGFGASGAG